ncbi:MULTISPECIES: HAD family hydrolase [unclassified Streptomyces]|uniref:HAD family hydrolase n=1 Tax=unclassified Streptomyces TaxID=2593676 RepID=UPI000DBA777C|nr:MULTISPECIES: HAD family hydrolase [unclassified Streptomyces]MYT75063.1 HAD-IA family hydrolase [Streptomyces sp. SID8367]RAJ77018.1 HAD superfamily hydrolase (TIGR01509 family)/HAD superfamily hydrolase (TIGR01549 family) [Streptomyces sp. PsTaAH-137]
MIRPFELVIFDCDGVLVDSERIAVGVQVELGAALGWPLTAEEVVATFIGRSHADIRALVADRLGEETASMWSKRFEERHREEVDARLVAVEGIGDALDALTLPTCVASSGSHDKMRHTLGRTGLYERFAGRIFSASEVARAKPAPDVFLHAARRMGVDPAACAVVEDSGNGVRAARSAGMRAFGYAGGLTPAEQLAGQDTVVFHHMRELPALIGARR